MVLDPFLHAPADRIDASLQLLASEARPLAHWTPVRLHHAATEVRARAALLEDGPIVPDSRGRIQLVLEHPIAAAVGDRFVLRDTSGSRTLGGGRFVDLRAPHRRRRAPVRRAQLDALAHDDPAAALAASLDRWPFFVDLTTFARDRALSDEQMGAVLRTVPHVPISSANAAVGLSPGTWKRLADSARAALDVFHRARPELPGLSLVQLAAAVEPRLPSRVCTSVVRALVEAGTLASEGGAIRVPEHRFGLGGRDQRLWQRIAPRLSEAERFRPPRAS